MIFNLLKSGLYTMHYFKQFIILFASLIVSGCSLLNGSPESPIDIDKISAEITPKLEKFDSNQITDPSTRNIAISQALTLIDLRYAEFVNNAGLQQRTKDMVFDFAELSLNLAGTAVGTAGTKTLLAALSTGISGTNIAFDKNFIYESTVPALIMQMNADRAELYRMIATGMQSTSTSGQNGYSWAQAVHDLIDYYNAGTLQHAINSIKKNAGSKQVAEEKLTKDLLMPQLATEDDVKMRASITSSLKNITEQNLAKVKTSFGPLSKGLVHLNGCKILGENTEATISVADAKNLLIECIRDVSEEKNKGVTFKDDLTEIKQQFITVGLIPTS
ncbi:hypothetical protein RO575_19940 [Methylomonas sp. MO1]|uniref:hypothetical protein n=2 Tax=unclassified Methylomonas TaxID=2608980 RepID=UPI0028A5161D|nr:hypothetical protein [Methylomonas sp. MO1]MDT4291842.1 hypothetical protein [Methylomonas sp. MO1]